MNFNVQLENGTSIGWGEICFQIPNIVDYAETPKERRKRGLSESNHLLTNLALQLHRMKRTGRPFEPSVDLNKFIFCTIVESLPIGCMIQNFLEMWNFDADEIKQLSKQDILNALYTTHYSKTTGHQASFERLLGGITRNESGHIVAATGILTNWMVYVNFSNVNHDKVGNSAGTEDWVSEEALLWEEEFLSTMQTAINDNDPDENISIYYSAGRRFVNCSMFDL